MGFPADLIDGMYVQADLSKEGQAIFLPVKGETIGFRDALGEKLRVMPPKSTKPNPDAIKRIMSDFNITDTSLRVNIPFAFISFPFFFIEQIIFQQFYLRKQ